MRKVRREIDISSEYRQRRCQCKRLGKWAGRKCQCRIHLNHRFVVVFTHTFNADGVRIGQMGCELLHARLNRRVRRIKLERMEMHFSRLGNIVYVGVQQRRKALQQRQQHDQYKIVPRLGHGLDCKRHP